MDLALLWLWCRLAAIALIRPLAWEPPYAAGAALKKKSKRPKKKKRFYLVTAVAQVLLWCGFNPWPRKFNVPWMWPKKKDYTLYKMRFNPGVLDD